MIQILAQTLLLSVARMKSRVTLLFPEDIKVEPLPPPKPPEPPKAKQQPARYIRTTQNDDAPAPPTKSDFISDRNTVASAKLAPDANGDMPLPTTNGVNVPTLELANRDFNSKVDDNAPTSVPSKPSKAQPPPPPAVKPQLRAPPEMEVQRPTKKTHPRPEKLEKDQAAFIKEGGDIFPA